MMIAETLEHLFENKRFSSWKAVRYRDVVTPKYINDLIQHGGSQDPGRPHPEAKPGRYIRRTNPFYYSDSMPDFHASKEFHPKFAHLKDLDYEDARVHPDFRKQLEYWLPIQFKWVRQQFKTYFEYGEKGIIADRGIRVEKPVLKRLASGGNLGIYWDFGREDVRERWGTRSRTAVEATLHGEIPEPSVDWIQTYVQNMDWFIGASETELRLIPGQPVYLTRISTDRGDIPVSPTGSWTA